MSSDLRFFLWRSSCTHHWLKVNRRVIFFCRNVVPLTTKSALIIDFMAHSRKVTGNKNKLKIRTFGDWMEYLWESFITLSDSAERIDVIFDLYLQTSRKDNERSNRAKTYGIKTNIGHIDQPLPAEMDKFWACDENKIALQQFFISWLSNTYTGIKSVYLGGGHDKGELYECYLLKDSIKHKVQSLRCTHEEVRI